MTLRELGRIASRGRGLGVEQNQKTKRNEKPNSRSNRKGNIPVILKELDQISEDSKKVGDAVRNMQKQKSVDKRFKFSEAKLSCN